jgi:hypothetical protein
MAIAWQHVMGSLHELHQNVNEGHRQVNKSGTWASTKCWCEAAAGMSASVPNKLAAGTHAKPNIV